jgi:hypothetical protein
MLALTSGVLLQPLAAAGKYYNEAGAADGCPGRMAAHYQSLTHFITR